MNAQECRILSRLYELLSQRYVCIPDNSGLCFPSLGDVRLIIIEDRDGQQRFLVSLIRYGQLTVRDYGLDEYDRLCAFLDVCSTGVSHDHIDR